MSTIIFDTIKGSLLDVQSAPGSNIKQQVRTGIIKDLDVVGSSDAEVLNKAFDAITAAVPFGTPHPRGDVGPFNRLILRPIESISNMLRFEMVYGTGAMSGNSAYLLRYSTVMQSYNTRFLPGTGRNRRIATLDFKDPDTGKTVKANSINMTLMRPIRTISVTSIQTGAPEEGDDDMVNLVNNAPWQGKPRGYWLVTGYETAISFYQGYYQASATVMTKGNENWFEVGVLVDPTTGLPVKVDEAKLGAALKSYDYGVFPYEGFVVVGPYETENFNVIFSGE